MIPVIINNFLDTYEDLKKYSLNAVFEDIQNPYDGVVYPLICKDIPERFINEIEEKLTIFLERAPEISVIFMRKSPRGVNVPHMAHTDYVMGKFSLMLYMNDNPNGGTSFLKHNRTGVMYAPESDDMVAELQKDQNDPESWQSMYTVPIQENRACIFDAGYFHRAEPVGGFGTLNNARCVLTCFFS